MKICFIVILIFLHLWSAIFVESVPKEERIITDLELLYGNQGVSVKYWYNETTSYNLTTSVPGCPKSVDGIPWIYYGFPPRCYLAGHYGPCPLKQKLLATEGSLFGVCACECVVDETQKGISFFQKQKKQRYMTCYNKGENESPYRQIYDTLNNFCYERGTQGPCMSDEIIVTSESDPIKCFPSCKLKNGLLGFFTENSCFEISVPRAAAYFVDPNKCGSNEKYSNALKKCVRDQKFLMF